MSSDSDSESDVVMKRRRTAGRATVAGYDSEDESSAKLPPQSQYALSRADAGVPASHPPDQSATSSMLADRKKQPSAGPSASASLNLSVPHEISENPKTSKRGYSGATSERPSNRDSSKRPGPSVGSSSSSSDRSSGDSSSSRSSSSRSASLTSSEDEGPPAGNRGSKRPSGVKPAAASTSTVSADLRQSGAARDRSSHRRSCSEGSSSRSSASGDSEGSSSSDSGDSESDSGRGSRSSSEDADSDRPLRDSVKVSKGARSRPNEVKSSSSPSGPSAKLKSSKKVVREKPKNTRPSSQSKKPAAPRRRSQSGATLGASSKRRRATPATEADRRRANPRKASHSDSAGSSSNNNDEGDDDDDDDEDEEGGERTPPRKLPIDRKSELISEVLARWWYCLPPWPPADFDYDSALNALKLKQVSLDDWEDLDDIDKDGLTKVYQVSHFPGVFRSPSGQAHDVRPLHNKPCYSELKKLSEEELLELLATALAKQLEELPLSPFSNTEQGYLERLTSRLTHHITEVQTELSKTKKRRLYLQNRNFESTDN